MAAPGFQYSENSAFSPVPFEVYDYAPASVIGGALTHHNHHQQQQNNFNNSGGNNSLGADGLSPHHHHHHGLSEYEISRHNQSLIEHWVNTAVTQHQQQSPPYQQQISPPYESPGATYSNQNNQHPFFKYPPSYLQDCMAGVMVAEPAFIRKRNERERIRVRNVNEGYARLRDHLPLEPTEKRLSKVETLRGAIKYIKLLKTILRDTDSSSTSSSTVSSRMTSSHHHGGQHFKEAAIRMTSTMTTMRRLTSDRRSDGEHDELDMSR